MLFSKNKTSKVAYTLWSGSEAQALFKQPQIINNPNAGCPAMSSMKNRLVALYPPISAEFEIYYEDGKPYYKYEIDTSIHTQKNEIHKFITDNVLLEAPKDNLLDLQLFLNYAFITDDKELEMITVAPYEMETHKAEYVFGTFNPYSWVRPVNSVWYVQDGTKLVFNRELPATYVLFNKPIELSFKENTGELSRFISETKNITAYVKKTSNLFSHVLSRRPKKLL